MCRLGAPSALGPFHRGVLGGAAGLLVGGLARVLVATPFVPELFILRLFESIPLHFFDLFVRQLGPLARWVAFAGTVSVCLGVSGLVGYACAGRFWGRSRSVRWATLTAFHFVLGSFVLLPLLGFNLWTDFMEPYSRVPAAIGFALVAGANALAFIDLHSHSR